MSYPTPMVPVPQRKKTSPWLVCGVAGAGCCVLIIPILAAILFPVFSMAREKARQTSCASNEKQLGIALAMYSQDYNEKFPPAGHWESLIYSYATIKVHPVGGRGSVLHCLDASSTNYGYAMNQADSQKSVNDINNLMGTVFVYESDAPNIDASGTLADADLSRHSNGSNLCFVDSHVRWYTVDSVKSASSGSSPSIIWNQPSRSK
jgi:prepilin-type processing-associated H-X9-DG protein